MLSGVVGGGPSLTGVASRASETLSAGIASKGSMYEHDCNQTCIDEPIIKTAKTILDLNLVSCFDVDIVQGKLAE